MVRFLGIRMHPYATFQGPARAGQAMRQQSAGCAEAQPATCRTTSAHQAAHAAKMLWIVVV